jgi:hypothetical protein
MLDKLDKEGMAEMEVMQEKQVVGHSGYFRWPEGG